MSSSLAEESGTSERTFERLYRTHRGDVYRSVLRDVRSPEEAEDVTQLAFLNAYRALKHGGEPEQPRAWLLAIARNVARRRYRSRAGRPVEVELDPELVAAPEHDGPTGTEIREALARLRPNYRAVLVLREIGGLSYAETAETLGLSVSAVETLLFRARRALREELTRESERRVVVGGIVLWPLSELFSNPAASLATWFGRQGLAAKGAALGGAAIIGTGAAVQTGTLTLPELGRQAPALEQPARIGDPASDPAASDPGPSGAKVTRADGARAAAKKQRRGETKTASAAAPASGEPAASEAPAQEPSESEEPLQPGLEVPLLNLSGGESPGTGETTSEVPLPEAPVPLNEPDVKLPEVEVPPLLPDAGKLLP
jgi:RNA polymerase sigma-70 factor, ECF subfamily